ncbi:hypothetical protein [Glaciibacter psychrotolerans]|uniref:Uncharacterized protein n=1 Tax=Glaciibacter psychrotolerans TaxID=670054 RepID=A0A7Z0EBU8_9MICO|nr:hypothetical protein [Leifsonia psychrotolerans]NYJ18744.1 hypothetical protein [Leifsonia psychrotolerans]
MTELQELVVPRKRNVKDLTASINALDSWASVSATFFTERFGAFNVAGTAHLSASIGSFTLAGRALEQNLKPDKTLQTLTITQVAGETPTEISVESIDEPAGDLSAVTALAHGDLVRARLHDSAYGDFTLTGVAVWSKVGTMILVGEWILSQEAAPAPRLRHLEIVAPAGAHGHLVPARITTVADDLEL